MRPKKLHNQHTLTRKDKLLLDMQSNYRHNQYFGWNYLQYWYERLSREDKGLIQKEYNTLIFEG